MMLYVLGFVGIVSFIVFFYHKAEVDKEEPAFHYESWRRFDDCDWCAVIL